MLTDYLDDLESAVFSLLTDRPEGFSEHRLIQSLQQRNPPLMPCDLADTLQLFQSHFVLFHVLYRLRDRLRHNGEAELEISPLQIVLRPFAAGEPALAVPDPLRAYYLNLDQLGRTTAGDVEALLAGFWRRFAARDGYAGALRELGLQAPVTREEAKRQYRRLVMLHHPDRGGDTEKLQRLNRSMALLRDYAFTPENS